MQNNIAISIHRDPFPHIDKIINSGSIEYQDNEEKVKLLLVRDLLRLNWGVEKSGEKLIFAPPKYYNKEIIKRSMSISRIEILDKNRDWIEKHSDLAEENLIDGKAVLRSKIIPRVEVCKTDKQHSIFRNFRYYWSSPYSEYIGRRIRLLIRDDGISSSPLIGIAAIGSSIIHIPERDKWISWNKEARTNNIIYMMDVYVLGALPPYNYLLGGKLISYIVASNEIRQIYKEKYSNRRTIIRKREAVDCVCLFTTSLYGNGSQYNRLKFNNRLLYILIGYTSGYGTLHISNETFAAMQSILLDKGIVITNRFGDGPNWRMRVIRSAAEVIGFDSNILLQHSFKRGIYAIPLARNFRSFLLGKSSKPIYYNLPMRRLVDFWKERWLAMRRKNSTVVNKVLEFHPKDFSVY